MTTLTSGPKTGANLKKGRSPPSTGKQERPSRAECSLFGFGGSVYNQIWEDPRVDAEALQIGPQSSLSDNLQWWLQCITTRLVHKPKKIVAVDLNAESHDASSRLKLAAVKHLPDYETFYNFFGYGQHKDNIAVYNEIAYANISTPKHVRSGNRVTGQERPSVLSESVTF